MLTSSLPTYADSTSLIVPLFTIAPSSSKIPVEHRFRSAVALWLTNSTVRPPLDYVFHFIDATSLKFGIADCKNLINEQNIRVEIGGNRKRQPDIHSAGIVLHWSIDEFLDFGEADDLVKFAIDFRPGHTEDRAVKIDVFSARSVHRGIPSQPQAG